MGRDGSDWDYINEHMGGHDEDGMPNFMSAPRFGEENECKEESNYFATFQEAMKWAKENPGQTFQRSEDGQGYCPIIESNSNDNIAENIKANQFRDSKPYNKQTNRFFGLDGHECVPILQDTFNKHSPHLRYLFSTGGSKFSRIAFNNDLKKLGRADTTELGLILSESVQHDNHVIKLMEKDARRLRKTMSSSFYDWVDTLEQAIDLCRNALRANTR